jgi:hypothetical protein
MKSSDVAILAEIQRITSGKLNIILSYFWANYAPQILMSFRDIILITTVHYAVLLFRPILPFDCDSKLGDELVLLFFIALEQKLK